MFDRLAAAIEELDPPVDLDASGELLGLVDRLQAKATAQLVAIDREKLWELDGATSLRNWLAGPGGQDRRSAGRLARTAARVAPLPAVVSAWQEGSLSGGQVETIVATITSATSSLFAEHHAELVPALSQLSVRETGMVMCDWQAKAEAILDPTGEHQAPETVQHSRTLDDRWHLAGSFGPESGHVIDKALEVFSTRDDPETVRTPAQRRADALVEVCRFAIEHQHDRPGRRNRPVITVVVPANRFVDTATRAPAGLVERLACDAELHQLVDDGTNLLDYGRRARTAPARLFNALAIRDQGCRFEGCDRPVNRTEAHHLLPWEHGGTTSVDNMVLLCSRHHHLIHQPGWSAKLKPDGELMVANPAGRVWRSHPPRFPGQTAFRAPRTPKTPSQREIPNAEEGPGSRDGRQRRPSENRSEAKARSDP